MRGHRKDLSENNLFLDLISIILVPQNSRRLKLMVIHQQILSNVSLSEEYQTHSEKKKSDNARKISAKVKLM